MSGIVRNLSLFVKHETAKGLTVGFQQAVGRYTFVRADGQKVLKTQCIHGFEVRDQPYGTDSSPVFQDNRDHRISARFTGAMKQAGSSFFTQKANFRRRIHRMAHGTMRKKLRR